MSSVVLASLGPIFAWGASDYLVGKSSKKFTALAALFSINIVAVPAAVIAVLLVDGGGIFNYWAEAVRVAAIATLMTIAYLSLTRALEIGPIGVASATANSYPLVTTLLAVVSGSKLSFSLVVGALIVFAGGALLSAEKHSESLRLFQSKAFRVAAIAVISWGVAFYLLGRTVSDLNWADVNMIITTMMALQCLLLMMVKKVNVGASFAQLSRINSWPMWVAGLLQSAGLAVFFLANQIGDDVVVPAVMASASPLFTTFLAVYFDKEKLLRINILGIFVIVIGIMLINSSAT